MSAVLFEGNSIPLEHGESVLDALLRHGHDIPNGCRAGACQSCLMVSESDGLPSAARQGLSDTQLALNQFLACQCIPTEPVEVTKANFDGLKLEGCVIEKDMLTAQVLRLRITTEEKLNYLAGQYVTLWNNQGLARSYSLASQSETEDFLEFHIKVIPNGAFSQWASQSLAVSDSITIQGPMGKCVYAAEADQPLLLGAIGTGLAPIYGILKDALHKQHTGDINIVLGAMNSGSFYLRDELKALANQHQNVQVHFIAKTTADSGDIPDDIYDYCKSKFTELKDTKIYLCGAQTFVQKMRKQCFLGGAAMSNISADVFLPFAK